MNWIVEFLNTSVEMEFHALPDDIQASIAHVFFLVRENGLMGTGMPYVRHIQGKLWEIRGKGKDGIARSLYVTAQGKRVVIVRSFIKKTQKTPPEEIKLALKRAQEVQ